MSTTESRVDPFPGLQHCVDDVVKAASPEAGEYFESKAVNDALEGATWQGVRDHLPLGYASALLYLFEKVFDSPGSCAKLALGDRRSTLPRDICQAIVMRKCLKETKRDDLLTAMNAAQEVACDLYDDFFDEAARQKVYTPARLPMATFIAWIKDGWHRTWTADQASRFGPRVPICMIPVGGAKHGLLGWAVLAHETVGHDVLSTYRGLLGELQRKVREALEARGLNEWADYWEPRVDEAASDLMGFLNMGPAYGVALAGYLRARREDPEYKKKNKNVRPFDSPYPTDVLRGYLVANATSQMSFTSKVWKAEHLRALSDVLRPAGSYGEDDIPYGTKGDDVAGIVARTILDTPLESLQNARGERFTIREIQDWTWDDEKLTEDLKKALEVGSLGGSTGDGTTLKRAYAAHLIAAAIGLAVSQDAPDLEKIQRDMITLLAGKFKERQNKPDWI